MAQQDDELISNTSYVNSDFRQIYPQLLDTAKKLTNKWDPTLSNESDPGNILIKEAAIVADKNNYHVDKNVLECFPLSATQQSSARQLYDLAGYKMHWYRSAIAPVSFTLLKSLDTIVKEQLDNNNEELSNIIIPAGTTIVDSSGEYAYTTLTQSSPLEEAGQVVSVNAIQGNIIEYEINGTYTITINNLDENLRLYFPQNIIAENGIFVFNEGSNPSVEGFVNTIYDNFSVIKLSELQNASGWILVDNLSDYPAGSKIFSFGLDLDSDTCYIQFPEDIIASDLIGSGLNIYYTTTSGVNGSIKSSILNKFSGDCVQPTYVNGIQSDSVVINDYIIINNQSSTEGKDPESLESAYKNYKKTIGTYKTLVSKRDYNNAIYNINNDLDTGSLISNGFVTDRVSDINFSQDVIVSNLNKDYTENYISKKDTDYWNLDESYSGFNSTDMYVNYYILHDNQFTLVTLSNKDSLNIIPGTTIAYTKNTADIINSYDVVLYLLQASDSINYISDYNKTFEPDISDEVLYSVQKDLDEYKSVQHNLSYANSKANSVYHHIDNVCILNGILNTYYKISNSEAKIIQDNVIKALLTKYNSREIDFGNELDYTELLETIKNSDTRIKSISLNIPEYEPILNYVENNQVNKKSLYSSGSIDDNNKTIAKMVLSGNVQLFKFKDDFQIDFGQVDSDSTDVLSNIKTYNEIDVECVTDKDTPLETTPLNQNDVIQIIYPSLITTDNYNPTVKYMSTFECNEGVYVLKENDRLRFIYNDNGVNKLSRNYVYGDIIRVTGFNILNTNSSDSDFNNVNSPTAKSIRTSQLVEILDISNITIPVGAKYYIVSNSLTSEGNYQLVLNANTPYILKENEYFIYTDNIGSGLVILGSGTTLLCEQNLTLSSKNISLDNILKSDDNTIQNVWNSLSQEITAQENTIINLGKGDRVAFLTENDASPISISSDDDLISIEDPSISAIGVVYRLASNTSETNDSVLLIGKTAFDSNIKIRSNMLLNINNLVPQVLVGNQKICIDLSTPNTYWAEGGESVLSNYALTMVGGDNLDIRVLNEISGEYESKVRFYKFTSNQSCISGLDIERKNGLLTLKRKVVEDTSYTLNYTFNVTANDPLYNYYLIPITGTLNKNVSFEIGVDNISDGWVICDDLTTGVWDTSYSYDNTTNQSVLLNKVLVLKGPASNSIIGDTSSTTLHFKYTGTGTPTADEVTSISFLYMKQLDGVNNSEIDCSTVVDDVAFNYSVDASDILSEIEKLPGSENFDWTYVVPDNNKVIKPLLANSYFNIKHVYNQCVLPKIDFEKTLIKVNSSNIL